MGKGSSLRPAARAFAFALCISVTASYAIVYTTLQHFSAGSVSGDRDVYHYLAQYRGEPDTGHWRYRVLVPWLARNVPALPEWAFDEGRQVTDIWTAKVRFAAVNAFFLCASGVLLFFFLSRLGFSHREAAGGVFLFFTSRPLIQCGGLPGVEAASYFFLLLCVYALLAQRIGLLAVSFLLGLAAKETTLLAVPAVLLYARRGRLRACLVMLPVVAAYLLIRYSWFPVPDETYFNVLLWPSVAGRIPRLFSVAKALDVLSAFGLWWVPAGYAFFHPRTPVSLKRGAYAVVLLGLLVVLLMLDLGRILFLAFPAVIPLALWGVRLWFADEIPRNQPVDTARIS